MLELLTKGFGYRTFLRLISKSFLTINKSLLHAKFQKNWLETVENRSDVKLLSYSVYGVIRAKALGHFEVKCSQRHLQITILI